MRVAIVGAGAMGGLWAGRLAAAGASVAVVDVSAPLVEAINRDGLALRRGEQTETIPLRATTRAEELGSVDAVFFFVKARHTVAAAEMARPLVGPDTAVVSLQNGWGNAGTLAAVYPPERLLVGVTYHSATVTAPGQVSHTGQGMTFLGPYADGAPLEQAEEIRDTLAAAGIEVTVTREVKTEVWKKLVLNAATLPTSSLTGLRSGELGQPGPLLELVDALAAEAVAVARAQGYDIDLVERVGRIHAVLSGAGPGKSSMLQDAEACRKTEIEVINGAVARAGEAHGVDVPLNRAMVALIGGLERGWRR